MIDFFLAQYFKGGPTTAFSAPHKYRVAQTEIDKRGILRIWNSGKSKVTSAFIKKLPFTEDEKFLFVAAPSEVRNFINELLSIIKSNYKNAVDISDCFKKNPDFKATTTTQILSSDELSKMFIFSINEFNKNELDKFDKILILDDVYALGNTMNGLRIKIQEAGFNCEIKTAVIVKVN